MRNRVHFGFPSGFGALGFAALTLTGCATRLATSAAVQPPAPVAQAMQRQIRNAADAGDGDIEARQLRATLDANPADTATRLELARHYQRAGFPDIALEHCRLACERAPESAEAHIELAKLLRTLNRAAEGAAGLAQFTSRHPENVDALAWVGILDDEAGDWAAGEIAHRKAVALAPNRDDLRNNLGFCLLQQGRNTEAAEEFRSALKLNPQSAFARNNLGVALVASPAGDPAANNAGNNAGDNKEAILNWQSVASPADAHSNLAAVLIEQGKYPEARHEIDLALGYNRQHAAALNNLRLVAELDGKAAEVRPSPRPASHFARLRAAWHRFWSGDASDRDTMNSGTAVASR